MKIVKLSDKLFSIDGIPSVILESHNYKSYSVLWKEKIIRIEHSIYYGYGILDKNILPGSNNISSITYYNSTYFTNKNSIPLLHNENGYGQWRENNFINQIETIYWWFKNRLILKLNICKENLDEDYRIHEAIDILNIHPNFIDGKKLPDWAIKKIESLGIL